MSKLTPEQIGEQLSDWQIEGNEIEKTFQFSDFKAAIEFVNRVADLAEKAQHHPDIEINYNKVEIELTTHDEGGVTQKDIDIAKQIETLL